jgi:hypothetical protein
MENVMMKRMVLFIACVSVALAGSTDGYLDGFITAGDGYQYGVTWRSFNQPLIVDGGGALDIQVRDNGRLIVQSTSTPLQRYVSGVYDILLFNNAQLEYLAGVTELISVRTDNAITILKGGTINNLESFQYGTTENIFIYAQKDSWSWIDNNPLKGIQGNWLADGLPFYIEFGNNTNLGFNPVWQNVKVIPEPATMLLLGLGGLILRKRKTAN